MRVSLLIFHLPSGTPNREVGKFVKKLYGQATSSWGGKYRYRRPGLLDRFPHRKLLRGVVIVRQRDQAEILAFLEEWGAAVEVRAIRPTTEDLEVLRKDSSAREEGGQFGDCPFSRCGK